MKGCFLGIREKKDTLEGEIKMTLLFSVCHAASLAPGATIAVTVGIDFNDTTQPASFNLW